MELDVILIRVGIEQSKRHGTHVSEPFAGHCVCGLDLEVLPSLRRLVGVPEDRVGHLDITFTRWGGRRCRLGERRGEAVRVPVLEDREKFGSDAGEGPIGHRKQEDGMDAVLKPDRDLGIVNGVVSLARLRGCVSRGPSRLCQARQARAQDKWCGAGRKEVCKCVCVCVCGIIRTILICWTLSARYLSVGAERCNAGQASGKCACGETGSK